MSTSCSVRLVTLSHVCRKSTRPLAWRLVQDGDGRAQLTGEDTTCQCEMKGMSWVERREEKRSASSFQDGNEGEDLLGKEPLRTEAVESSVSKRHNARVTR